jgi:hypothetical protein
MDDANGIWHDFVTDEGGGVLDLVAKVQGSNRQSALVWLSAFTGLPLEDHPLSPLERARWAAERHRVKNQLPRALAWRRSAVALAEDLLEVLKIRLFDPTADGRPEVGELQHLTKLQARWQRLEGADLVGEYGWWAEHHPKITAVMVHVSQTRAEAERRAVEIYLKMTANGAQTKWPPTSGS